MQVLLFELSGEEYGILLNDVEFISGKMNIVKVPDVLEAVSGIVMLRGSTVPVYSLASRLGIARQGTGYLVVVKVDDMNLALEVELIRLLDVNGLVPSRDRTEFCMAIKKCMDEITPLEMV